jgi:hypothetical protein
MRYVNFRDNWSNGIYFEFEDKKSLYEEVILAGYKNGTYYMHTVDCLTGARNGNEQYYSPQEKSYIKRMINKKMGV